MSISENEEIGKVLLDLLLHRLRGGRPLLLRDADLKDPVLQLRGRLLRHDLRGEVEGPVVSPEGPLAEEVRLVVLLPHSADLRPDLQALGGRLDLDLVLRDPRQLRRHDELRALVTNVDRRNADSVLTGESGPGPRGQDPPELPADVVDPAVHVREHAERVRWDSPEGEVLARLGCDLHCLCLAHHRGRLHYLTLSCILAEGVHKPFTVAARRYTARF